MSHIDLLTKEIAEARQEWNKDQSPFHGNTDKFKGYITGLVTARSLIKTYSKQNNMNVLSILYPILQKFKEGNPKGYAIAAYVAFFLWLLFTANLSLEFLPAAKWVSIVATAVTTYLFPSFWKIDGGSIQMRSPEGSFGFWTPMLTFSLCTAALYFGFLHNGTPELWPWYKTALIITGWVGACFGTTLIAYRLTR